jgi:hypothetical protein
MRNFILGLSFSAVFIVGCLVGATRDDQAVPPVIAGPAGGQEKPGNRHSYYCLEEYRVQVVTRTAQKMGKAGWRLVASAGSANSQYGHRMIWCFEKRY